jgi:IS30 family transposase
MSASGTNEDEIRDALDAVAKNYNPPTRPRFATLLPFKRQIEFLRSQKASFRMIAKLLEPHSVQTSRETVRRFYHDIIEGLPPKQRQKIRRTKAGPKRKMRKTKTAMPFIPISQGQPRIARIEDL